MFLFAGSPLAVYFGHRPFAEVVSAPFVTWGLALVAASAGTDQSPPHRWRIGFVAGASLLGFAVLLRLQNAAFAAVLLAVYRWEGRQRAYRAALDVLVVWALIYGAVDWIAWGLPYQSVGAYLHFNLGLGGTTAYYGSSAFGASRRRPGSESTAR
ncbi:MAG: hypothetical protein ABEL76_07160, partial [Bradymonadaceae bacterium]